MGQRDTQTRILDTAEQLFAERGFAQTSLREITAQAGVNLAAVNYHFGSKDALIEAVFRRLFEPVNRRRLEMLDTAERQAATDGNAPELEQVLEAFVVPPVDMWQEGERGLVVLGLFSRAMVEWRTQFEHVQKEVFSEILHRFVPALRRNLSHLDDDELGWRIHFMIGALAIGVQSHRRMRYVAPELGRSQEGMDHLREYLTTYLAAAFRAPASEWKPDRVASDPQRATPTALGKERD